MNPASRAVTVAATLASASVLLLAGCSSAGAPASGPTTNASPTASSADGSSAAPASAAAASGPLTGDRLCALVSPAQAQEALAVSPRVTDQEPGTFTNGEPECGFASDDKQTVIVNVTVFDAAKNPFNPGKFEMAGDGAPSAVTVAGHQGAVNGTELDVADGDKVLTIENFGSANATRDGLIALAELFLPKL